jgi:hypothetical protein
MTSMALRKCANGGLKILANGRLDTCCDPCEITIDLERKRIQALPDLTNFFEGEEGLLVVENHDQSKNEYYVRHVFAYTYYDENAGWPIDVLEYFDCENCDKIVLYSSNDGFITWHYRFFYLPDSCHGCIVKMRDPTLLATIDEKGPHEANWDNFTYHLLYTYTNSSDTPQVVFYEEGGDQRPESMDIDNWAQLLKNGQVPQEEGYNISSVLLYPHESVSLYDINQSHLLVGNPWEVHCKVYMAEVICDPCEVAIYEATTEEGVTQVYGAGYFTGGSSEQPYKAAYLTDIMDTLTMWGFTCDTCEKVRLWSGYAGDSPEIPYREDETACDGEDEVQ